MKKQLLIAAVAATMGTAVIADISITGNAEYKYTHTELESKSTSNAASTEVNIKIKGSHGDTTVYLDQEFTASNLTDGDNEGMDIENLYLKTKVGPLSVTAGNWTGSTSANTGQIKDNGRSTNKISVSTAAGPVTLGFWTTPGSGSSDGFTVSGEVAGVKVGLKEASNEYTDINVSGEISGVSYRLDNYDAEASADDAFYGMVSKKFKDVTFTANHLEATKGATLTETDGAFGKIFEGDATTYKISRIAAAMDVAGNAVTVAVLNSTEDNGSDNDAIKVTASRTLAAGMKVTAAYKNVDNVLATNGGVGETATTTLELDVSF
jgi:hypothetical protein